MGGNAFSISTEIDTPKGPNKTKVQVPSSPVVAIQQIVQKAQEAIPANNRNRGHFTTRLRDMGTAYLNLANTYMEGYQQSVKQNYNITLSDELITLFLTGRITEQAFGQRLGQLRRGDNSRLSNKDIGAIVTSALDCRNSVNSTVHEAEINIMRAKDLAIADNKQAFDNFVDMVMISVTARINILKGISNTPALRKSSIGVLGSAVNAYLGVPSKVREETQKEKEEREKKEIEVIKAINEYMANDAKLSRIINQIKKFYRDLEKNSAYIKKAYGL